MKVNTASFLKNFSQLIKQNKPIVVEKRGRAIGVFIPLVSELEEAEDPLFREAKVVAKRLVVIEEAQQQRISLEEMAALLKRKRKNGY